jgi:hypothetical protein
VNLVPFPYNTLTINADGVKGSIDEAQRLIINGTATRTTDHLLAKITLPMGNYCLTTNQSNENTRIYLRKNGGFITSRAKGDSPYIFAVESNTDVYSITAVMLLDGVFSNDIIVPMLNKGATAQPYRPYTRNTLPIPEAVQALDGYGEGNPDDPTEYNSIQWDKKGNCSYSHKGNIVNNEWVPLSNEIVTDISALITADNLIPVQGNGTITFVNEYGYAVPSTVEYMT